MDLASLRRGRSRVTVDFGNEEPLHIDYNPHAYDDECQRIVNGMRDESDNSSLAKVFDKLVIAWDLKDDGRQVPCSIDAYLQLPPFLRTKIINVLIDDELELGKLKASEVTLSQTRRSALVPIGTSSGSQSNGQE